MSDGFYKFPTTPHILAPEGALSREDKLVGPSELELLLTSPATVEEKVDGANVGISFDGDGNLRLQNRGNYLTRGEHPQFGPLWPWVWSRHDALRAQLGRNLVLFGEWCYARHSVEYDALPDYFIGFDIYDRGEERFYSVQRRGTVLSALSVSAVPRLFEGTIGSLDALRALLPQSAYGHAPAEGLYVRVDDGEWLALRAKLVRPEFMEGISEHWSSKPLVANRLRST